MKFLKYFLIFIASWAVVIPVYNMDTLELSPSFVELERIKAPFIFDSTKSLSLDQVIEYFDKGSFIESSSVEQEFSPLLGQYWLRFSLSNNQELDGHWVFNFRNWPHIEVYEISDSNIPIKQTGFFVPYNKRDYPFANKNHVLTSIEASETKTFIIKLIGGSDHTLIPSGIDFDIRTQNIQDNINHRNELILGVFGGIFFILFFYNLFIYFSTRDLEYLIYLGQIIAIFYAIYANAGYNISAFSHIESFPQYRSLIESIAGTIGPALMIVFTMYFLNTKINLPFWHKVLKWLLIGIAPLTIGTIVNYTIAGPIAYLYSFILLIIFITIGIKSIRKKVPSAGYYLAAYIFSVFGMFILLFALAGVLPQTDFTMNYALPTGYALELLFFSFALANKINTLKRKSNLQKEEIIQHLREKELMQKNITAKLEQKVQERTKEIRDQNILIEKERHKSDELLLNILPETAVNELKTTGSSKSKIHEDVTIMFTDFKGFTHTASILTPDKLISELNDIFHEFDDIVERNNVEKIKTIGDAYLAVAGLFDDEEDHAHRTISAAIEMQQYLAERNEVSDIKWNIRIGIHSGPVISGVVGKKKFAFDIWGDSVNIASRIESAGEIDQINISANTHELTKDTFKVNDRGKIMAKGKGQINMYFVEFPKKKAV